MINFCRSLLIFLFISLLFLVTIIIQHGHEKSSTQQHYKHLHSISRKKKSAPPPPDQLPSNNNGNAVVFNAVSYGAVGDGITDDTEAIKKAWNATCQSQTSAMLLLPQRYSFIIRTTSFSGPCQNDQLVFQIDGTIMPPDGPKNWATKSKEEWLVFERVQGMSMQGRGVIDGRGEKWWNLSCKDHNEGSNCDSPAAIRLLGSSNVRMQGLGVENSPKFHIVIDECEDIHIESLSIKSPADSPNTDGIHVENSKNVEIYHSTISTGDDCISIGAGSFNVDIKNITCGPSHGISIGSLGKDESRACVSDISVSDSVIKNSDNGVRIKTWQGGSGSVSKVTFSNIQMETVQNPIIIDQYYCLQKKCPNRTSALMISDIKYTNIYGTYDTDHPPVYLACSDSIPCTNITLSGLKLRPAQRKSVSDPFCWKAYGNVHTISANPLPCLLKGFPERIRLQHAEKLC